MSRARRWLLFVLAPLWGPPFLLTQTILLCADGLLQLLGIMPAGRALGRRWAVGVPALLLFPLIVGLRGLTGLLLGLGQASFAFLRLGIRGRAATLAAGLISGMMLPVWLPLALVVWLLRWVLWRLLVPEFTRMLDAGDRQGDSRLVTFIGLRYLFGRRETALHSATAYFAAGGIALGVCALIVVLAVMSGFDREVKLRIVGTNAHVVVLRFGTSGMANADSLGRIVAQHPEVRAVAPFVYGTAMLSAGEAAEGAVIKGIRWEDELEVTALGQYVTASQSPPPLAREDDRLPGVILGRHLVDRLGLLPGDDLLLVSPAESRRTPLGFVPRMRRFTLAGVFDSGMYDFDATYAFVDLREGQSFFGLGQRVTGIEARIAEMDDAQRVADEVVDRLGGFPYRANNWIDLNSNLFAWMRTEKQAMFVILIMIILVAGFNIASSLIMLVTDKRREIGILKSMGATAMTILRIFVLEGWVMALSGTAVGAGVGLLICDLLERHELITLPADVYFIDRLPIRVEWMDVGLIVISVLIIAALSTLYPSWRASQMDPIEAIRSE